MKGNSQKWTLLHLKYRKHIRADNGRDGGSQNSFGADGGDIILDVPLGTIAKDAETGEKLLEILVHNEKKNFAKGRKRGTRKFTL